MATLSQEKSRKIISDQISRHFSQLGATLIFFMLTTFFSEGGGEGQKIQKLFRTNFLANSANLGQLCFFHVDQIIFRGAGGSKIRKLFPTNFLAISANLE